MLMNCTDEVEQECVSIDTPEVQTRPHLSNACDAIRGKLGNGLGGREKKKISVRMAVDRASREKAFQLAFEVYHRVGYVNPAADKPLCVHPWDASSHTLVLLAEDETGRALGTASMVFDSPVGVPSDGIYSDELEILRNSGSRFTEIVRFAMMPGCKQSRAVQLALFNHLFLYAWYARGYTDFIIHVTRKHAPFYRRYLSFEQIGTERSCSRVAGTKGVLLRLDLSIPGRFSRGALPTNNSSSLYPNTMAAGQAQRLAQHMARAYQPMTPESAKYFGLKPNKPMAEGNPGSIKKAKHKTTTLN